MYLSIRNWLLENGIEIQALRDFSQGQLVGMALHIIQDMEVKSLIPFDICTLAEVLEFPLGIVWQEMTTMAQLTQSLVSALSKKKPLKRSEGTWLAFQIAYLRALHQVLKQEESLQRPWLERAMMWNSSTLRQTSPTPAYRPLSHPQLQGLLKTLYPGKLTDTQAEQALSLVAESLLVQQISNATVTWLIVNGVEEPEAKLLIQRLLNGLHGQLLTAIAENAPPFAQLQKFVGLGNSLLVNEEKIGVEGVVFPSSTAGDKIDLYRERYRASLIEQQSEPLFMEFFALKDIYVPPKGLVLEENHSQTVDLLTWAQQQLDNLETIAVIESEPGYGKTSFCSMWAAHIAWESYPTWTPILIRLRDVTHHTSIEATLNSGLPKNFQHKFLEWLELKHLKFLFLLDGLDELPTSHLSLKTKTHFLRQLIRFQSQHRHKIVLTSRCSALPEIVKELSIFLKRIQIQPWQQNELKLWFQQWAKVQSLPIAQNFFTFLKQAGVFATKSQLPELSTLVCQPLILYLLGVLHRDGLLDHAILLRAASTHNKVRAELIWEIYYRLSRWLLGYSQPGGINTMFLRLTSTHIHRTQEAIATLLQGQTPQELWAKMQTVALQILLSHRYQLNLNDDLRNLPAFYFRKNPHNSVVEFSHLKMGEFLCAEAILSHLKLLVQHTINSYGEQTFILDSSCTVAQHLYNLLGYGILSEEIEELVIEGLRREQKQQFFFTMLCDRLQAFWYSYCQGRWLDEGIAHKAIEHFQSLHNSVRVEQVNAAVGFNVFLLLCACHQEAKTSFLPCGDPASPESFYPEALIVLMARTTILGESAFATRMRAKSLSVLNLSWACLSQVSLAGWNLEKANLSNAELKGTNLAGANLQKTNLQNANLTDANFVGANLSGANFTGANLTRANLTNLDLSSVILTNACLFQAVLQETARETAQLNGAIFSLKEFSLLRSILTQEALVDTTEARDDTTTAVNNTSNVAFIENVEGKPALSISLYDEQDNKDETILGNHLAENSNGYE